MDRHSWDAWFRVMTCWWEAVGKGLKDAWTVGKGLFQGAGMLGGGGLEKCEARWGNAWTVGKACFRMKTCWWEAVWKNVRQSFGAGLVQGTDILPAGGGGKVWR